MVYASGVSDEVIALCTGSSSKTLTSALAAATEHKSGGKAGKGKASKETRTPACYTTWEQLYPKPFVLKRLVNRFFIKHDLYHGRGDPTEHDLDRAAQCGRFPYRPSDTFLKMFSDVLLCLERDPMAGVCSPPLLGTSGVMPLSIISVIPDIMQHYYDCIVRAEQEVILATNYWQPSNSVEKITAGLRELSQRAGKRGQKEKIIVKIMWDRGTLSQLYDNHAMVDQAGREALKLPKLEEIPNLHLEVINFHRPIMGTFHAKFLIVDRKVALLNSNNIQDRPNLEMMIHLEGAVVESFYDIFLYSWHHALSPALPCLMAPPPDHGTRAEDFRFMEMNPYLSDIQLVKAAKAARAMLTKQHGDDERLAKMREQATHGPQGGRFQAVLGALTESRRGSFSAEGDTERLAQGSSGADRAEKKEPAVRFTDVVFQAMERRRKSFGGGQAMRERPQDVQETAPHAESASSTSHMNGNALPNSTSQPAKALSKQSSPEAPGLINWSETGLAESSDDRHAFVDDNATQDNEPQREMETSPSEHHGANGQAARTDAEAEMMRKRGLEAAVGSSAANGHADPAAQPNGAPQLPQSIDTGSSPRGLHDSAATPNGVSDADMYPTSVGPSGTGAATPVPISGGSAMKKQVSQAGSVGKKGRKSGLSINTSRSRSGSIKAAPSGPPGSHTPRQRALSTVLNAGALSEAWSTVEDTDLLDEFNPHTLHKPHDPFPIAMVNRKPHGLPGHQDIRVPQDAAWLAGFRYAQKSVFIQTPTFNAKPVIRAALAACRRGVQVTIYVDLGFNDKGESMPFQGGTNEEVVERMYKDLNWSGHQKNLHVFWYVGKDQVRPLNAVKKQRNCHVKFMQVDGHVGIQGNGNQDTQSWYHSCEINVMVDSASIVADWMAAIHRQQNTQRYGRVDDDGIWRDKASGRTPAEMEEWENEQRRRQAEDEDEEGAKTETQSNGTAKGAATPVGSQSKRANISGRSGASNGTPASTPSGLRQEDSTASLTTT